MGSRPATNRRMEIGKVAEPHTVEIQRPKVASRSTIMDGNHFSFLSGFSCACVAITIRHSLLVRF